ncbi:alpha/beta hydrolase [Nannocystis pusilla]|uniref:alpha/beta hydrolase n=1 Tax=Nannocystis pusilla TaxID=889268 RepID=UPI003DA45824
MQNLCIVLSIVSLVFAGLPWIRIKSRATLFVLLFNFFGTAWAHYVALAGAVGALLGLAFGSVLAFIVGLVASVLAASHVYAVTVPHDDALARGLGDDWRKRISTEAERKMLQHRWSWRVPSAPAAEVTRDVAFATVPGAGRRLLCDLWRPPPGVTPTGVAIVYLHGSAWCLIDKDVGTRAFFSHLAAQGHVVMDVGYRLCPETDAFGMVGDAKRAIVWMKAHAAEYGVSPEKVVLMGGSAGGHIALLAVYTPRHVELTPGDLRGDDTSVRAVVSYYGVPDLRAYDAWARRLEPPGGTPVQPVRLPPGKFATALYRRLFGRLMKPENMPPPPPHRQLMRYLVGGLPEEIHGRFDLASPVRHVGRDCPLTLHFQGEYDHIVSVESARAFHRALVEARVPAVYIELPRTLHAFDLMIPPLFAPAGQAALYDLERFLACIA